MHPKELTNRNHRIVSELFRKWGISFDNYSRTENPNHIRFVRETFKRIEENGYIFTQEMDLPYCEKCSRFLPDRFVEGTCPYCGFEGARGDQCEKCGRLTDPARLIDPYCTICGSKPIIKRVKHWYFDMPKFTDQLIKYIENNKRLSVNARNFSLNILREGLKPRPITRDNEWGVPAPFKGSEGKTIYVWFEAVLGYVSATIEYFKNRGSEGWREYWFNRDAKTLYFIGKDNIPFHTLILPALLLATHEGYNLPWNVCTNEFLTFKGQKLSKSRRVGIWIDEALQMFPVDYWRYTLISIRPETRDSNFSWSIFLEKVNSDLNDTLGNFVHRTLVFINRYFKGVVPAPKDLSDDDKLVLDNVKAQVNKVSEDLEKFKLQAALRDAVELSRLGNRYLNEKQPWKTIKVDPQSAGNVLYVSIQILKALSVILEPFMPFTSKEMRRMLNIREDVRWDDALTPINPGHRIGEAKILFRKIEENEDKLQEMLEEIRMKSERVSFEDFSKIDIRIGRIVEVKPIPKSKKLLELVIDIGDGDTRRCVAGIAEHYSREDLVGRLVAVVANLKPKKVFGVSSEVMILAAVDGENLALIQPDKPVKAGSKIS